jgi:two-component system response regulator
MNSEAILLAEDCTDDVALTLRALESCNISAERVALACDGVEALDYLFGNGQYSNRDIRNQPQLILLDLGLPKIDGIEVLRRVRQDSRTWHVPVVVLTATAEKAEIVKIYSLGANSLVQKLVNFSEFVEAIRRLGVYWLEVNLLPPNENNA